jgi:hypothetical protein
MLERRPRNYFRLIESALCFLLRIQRHGNNRDSPGWKRRLERQDRIRQQSTQSRSEGANPIKLQKMNQIAEIALVTAISHRPIERRMSFPANAAAGISGVETRRKVAGFAANLAERAGKWLKLANAIRTNRKPGNFNEWGAANAAIGWKKSKEETGGNALCPASDRGGRSCGLGSPYSKPSTAEDALPAPGRGAAAPGDNASIVSL